MIIAIVALVAALASAVFLIITKRKEKAAGEKVTKDVSKETKSTLDVLAIRHYDENIDAYVLEDGTYLDIMEIIPRDRRNMRADEIELDNAVLARFGRLYTADYKIIGINFPMDTSKQQGALQRKLDKTPDPVRKKWLEREIKELKKVDANRDRREFYRIYFGATEEQLLENRTKVLNYLWGFVREIDKTKKFQVMRKICNMNTLVASELGGEDEKE